MVMPSGEDHETVAFATAFPDASVAFTTSGSKLAKTPNGHVGHVNWPLPEMGERFATVCAGAAPAKSSPAAIAIIDRNLNLGKSTS
jgi:hypothetical protein